MFHKPVGKEHESMYNAWWNKNIKPIWGDVKKIYLNKLFKIRTKQVF